VATNLRFLNPETIAKPPGYTHVVEVTGCRFRKLHPFDSRSLANQNMTAGCSLLPSFSSARCATVSSRDGGLKLKFWCCGINSTSCSSARRVGYISVGPIALCSYGSIAAIRASLMP
jgi:hypothetical protein